MQQFYEERSNALKTRDREKETDPEWFRKKEMLGMMLYIDNFAGTSAAWKRSWIIFRTAM